jgi:transcriptional regulator with XRE-family HTH domain
MNNILEGFGTVAKVKALMAAKEMTMEDMAKVLGVSVSTVGNRFDNNDWKLTEMKALAEYFGTELTDLT